MRGKIKKVKAFIMPDPLYNSVAVEKFINYAMTDGKKNAARKTVYGALDIAKEELKSKSPADLLESTLNKIAPIVEVKSRRVGGANYQVPMEVKEPRKTALAMRWLLESAKSQKGQPMSKKLAQEIINVAHNTGSALKKREEVHKMAEANRAFAHFARY